MRVPVGNNRVLVAMSGGIDSSVAAGILVGQGYEVAGATLKMYGEAGGNNGADIEDAQKVARKLGIQHYVFDFRDIFRDVVTTPFVTSYRDGLTPNPCIECNRKIKFGAFMKQAAELGYGRIATGHYANVESDNITGRYLLRKAADISKDQTYVLYGLTQEQLSAILFPLGRITKDEVRIEAARLEFENRNRRESQDICFINEGRYSDFIKDQTGGKLKKGLFKDKHGNILGKHEGAEMYTIGQRKGLGTGFGRRMYVTGKLPETGDVILGEDEDLYSCGLAASGINLIFMPQAAGTEHEVKEPPVASQKDSLMASQKALPLAIKPVENLPDKQENVQTFRAKAKIRYNQKEEDATIILTGDGQAEVIFAKPQRAVTPGQAVVFYDGDMVVGGGTITESINAVSIKPK